MSRNSSSAGTPPESKAHLRGQLPHRSRAANATATVGGGTVETALRVHDHSAQGPPPVRTPSEAVQHSLLARLTQLVHHSLTGRATVPGGAVEVALGVHNHACEGFLPVRPGEVVQHGLLSLLAHLPHNSVA